MRWLVTTSDYVGDRLQNYLTWITAAGVEAVLLDATQPEPAGAVSCDALLLSGGGDVAPSAYGATPHPETSDIQPARDRMELEWIRRFLDAGRPIFGICRGLQILHVAFGGGLIQHVPEIVPAAAGERHAEGKDDASHGIRWQPGARLSAICGTAPTVNSHHHQAADPARPARGLRVAALSPSGIVEAMESSGGLPLSAVQWHPERMADRGHPASGALLRHWIALAGGHR